MQRDELRDYLLGFPSNGYWGQVCTSPASALHLPRLTICSRVPIHAQNDVWFARNGALLRRASALLPGVRRSP